MWGGGAAEQGKLGESNTEMVSILDYRYLGEMGLTGKEVERLHKEREQEREARSQALSLLYSTAHAKCPTARLSNGHTIPLVGLGTWYGVLIVPMGAGTPCCSFRGASQIIIMGSHPSHPLTPLQQESSKGRGAASCAVCAAFRVPPHRYLLTQSALTWSCKHPCSIAHRIFHFSDHTDCASVYANEHEVSTGVCANTAAKVSPDDLCVMQCGHTA